MLSKVHTIINLTPGTTLIHVHGLERTPASIIPDRSTPIIVVSADSTTVTFRNDGIGNESAIFRIRVEHSIVSEGIDPLLWKGGFPAFNGHIPTAYIAQDLAINYYVATTGSDSNDGLTTLTPLLTINAAIAKIGFVLNATPIINLAVGTYKEFVSPVIYGSGITLKSLNIVGPAMVAYTPTTGPQTGTFTSAAAITSTAGVVGNAGIKVTLTAAGWTVDDLKGRFIRFISGAGTYDGYVLPIASNTVDGFDLPLPTAAAALVATAVFVIETPGAIIQVPDVIPPQYTTSGVITALGSAALQLTNIEVNGSTTARYTVLVGDQGAVTMTQCRLIGGVTGYPLCPMRNNSYLSVTKTFLGTLGTSAGISGDSTARGSTLYCAWVVITPITGTSTSSPLSISGAANIYFTIIQNYTSAAGLTYSSNGVQPPNGVLVRNCKHGIYILGDSPQTINGTNITVFNCNNHAIRSTCLSNTIYYFNGLVISECYSGIIFVNGHSTIQLTGTCNITNSAGAGIYVGDYNLKGVHSFCKIGAAVSMSGNVAGDIQIDGVNYISLATLRAAPGKRITNLDFFNILLAD
jgi:hypothetical protein